MHQPKTASQNSSARSMTLKYDEGRSLVMLYIRQVEKIYKAVFVGIAICGKGVWPSDTRELLWPRGVIM
jgi:hypothetical protein